MGPKAEFSVEEPMANSSRLVLPTITAPARRQALHDGGVVGGQPAIEDPGRAGRRHTPGAQVVLERDGHPGQWPGVTAGGDRFVDPVGRGPGHSSVTRLKA